MKERRNLTCAVAACFLLLWALLTHSHVNSWNDASRLATIEALVHQGTWAIEGTAFGDRTADRVFLNGHFYSDKPPVLSFLAAGVYTVLHRGFHLSFDSTGWCDPVASPCYCFALLCPQPPDWAYYLLTLALIGLPSALMLALFYRSTAFLDVPNPLALLVTAALGLGTLVFPYSLVFNNQIPAAASVMVGFYALLRSKTCNSSSAGWLLVAGFATALAFTFDLLAVPFLVFFLGVTLLRHRRRTWAFLLGSFIPLLLLGALDWWILGDPLPPSMHPSGFSYPDSLFPSTPTGNLAPANVLEYGFRMMFGDRGLLNLSPVSLWSVFGLWLLFRERSHRLWSEMVALALASLSLVLGLALFTQDFGGLSYGARWLTEAVPPLFFFAARPGLYRSLWQRLLFAALTAISLFSAWQGAINPWGVTLPPFRLLEYATSAIGRYVESVPPGTILYTTPSRVRYLPVSPVHAWHTSLREFDVASAGALPAGDPDRPAVYVLSADDQTTGKLLEATFPHGQWELITEQFAVYHVPPGADRVRPARQLRAGFAGQMQLLGCDPPPASLHSGHTLTVRLYWRALAPMYHRYTAFTHLLGPPNLSTGGPLWAQDDHQPGRTVYPTDRWLPGEVVLDQFQFVIPDNAPPGEYTLTTGFYDLVTLQRLVRSDAQGDTATLSHITVVR